MGMLHIPIDEHTFHAMATAAGYVRLKDLGDAYARAVRGSPEGVVVNPAYSRSIPKIPDAPDTRHCTVIAIGAGDKKPELAGSGGGSNAFLADVSALEQPEDLKPAPTRKEVKAAFRELIEKHSGSQEILQKLRGVLDKLGAANEPSIPEEKFAEAMQLLKAIQ